MATDGIGHDADRRPWSRSGRPARLPIVGLGSSKPVLEIQAAYGCLPDEAMKRRMREFVRDF